MKTLQSDSVYASADLDGDGRVYYLSVIFDYFWDTA